jgi:hypothetical protein
MLKKEATLLLRCFFDVKERSNITASMLPWCEREKQHYCFDASLM